MKVINLKMKIVLKFDEKIDVIMLEKNEKVECIGVSGTLYTEHPRQLSNTCHTPPALPQHSNSHPQQNNFCMTSSCAARRKTSGIV